MRFYNLHGLGLVLCVEGKSSLTLLLIAGVEVQTSCLSLFILLWDYLWWDKEWVFCSGGSWRISRVFLVSFSCCV